MTQAAEQKTSIAERIAKLHEQKKTLDQKIRIEQSKLAKKQRAQRTRDLIEIGGLANIAELINTDKGTLLGAFLEIAAALKKEPAKSIAWKAMGDELLKRREEARKQ